MALMLALSPMLTSALHISMRPYHGARAASIYMYEESKPFQLAPAITRGSDTSPRQGPSVVVTSGSGAFYPVRQLIQMLHDYGAHSSIKTHSDSAAATKKSLLSRQARYSGLLDVLECREGELASAMTDADYWLAIDADVATLPAQIAAAKQCGIRRCFVLLSSALDDPPAAEALLVESGLRYTVMRTGSLVEAADSGGGLRIGDIDMAVCDDVSQEDVFRFVTEALTLPEAEGRLFSLCPSEDSESLKQMRLCGYGRREEVQALLRGYIVEEGAKEAMEAEAEPELVMRSEAEVATERAEELRALLEKARARGEATQRKLKFEEEEKAREREAQQKYYAKPDEPTVE